MTEEQIGAALVGMDRKLFEQYKQQCLETRPLSGMETLKREQIKNRYHISAKLTPETYAALYAYAKAKDLSLNSAIKEILKHYFAIQHA